MKLRQKTLYLVGGTLTVLLLLIALVVTRQSLRGFERLEQQALTRDMERLLNTFTDEIGEMGRNLSDYGRWDDTALFVQGEYEDYAEDNLLDSYMPETFELDAMVIASKDGTLFYSRSYDAEQGATAMQPEVLEHLKPYLTRSSEQLSETTGVLLLPSGAAMVAAVPITNSQGVAPAVGSILGLIYLHGDFWSELEEQTRLAVDYHSLDTLPEDFREAKDQLEQSTNLSFVRALDSETAGAYTLMHDLSEKPVGMVGIREKRTIYQQGRQQLWLMLVSLLTLGVLFTLLLLVLLERTILSRLSYLSGTVRDISKSGLFTKRMTALGKDELSDLTSDLNGMLQVIEERTQALERSKAALEHANQELGRSNQELERFAYVASHDLQEPLRKVQTFSDRLRSKYADTLGDDGKLYIERMQDATARMRTLIQDLLIYSRVQNGAVDLKRVDIGDIVKGVVADLEVRLEQSGGRIEVGDLPALQADPMQMRQVFQNLIGNALKFRKSDVAPVVQISSAVVDNAYEIAVKDNGIGFEQQHSEKVFGVFQRLHGRSEYEGTGIGLAIVKKVLEKHGGSVRVESTPGQGSEFLLRLYRLRINP
jgi:signal transduction histidine kinase